MIKLILACILFLMLSKVSAQNNNNIIVKAGERVGDCIPIESRYRYSEFSQGSVIFKNGKGANPRLNYNLLTSEMEYIEQKDTLSILHPESILIISIASDTFYYDQGYLELIFSGDIKVARKQYFELKKMLKKDSYGSSESNAAIDSYSTIETNNNNYKLVTNTDRIYEKKILYFISIQSINYMPFTKKKTIQLFPQSENSIHQFIKSENIKFNKEPDLLKLAAFLEKL